MIALNWFAIIVAAIINMALGFFWYSQILFGKKWMTLMGVKEVDMKKGMSSNDMWKNYGLTFVGAVITAFVLSLFAYYKSADTLLEGALLGALLWIGLVIPTSLSGVLFEKKPVNLYFINMGFYLVSLIVMGGIVAVW
ncbi:MAG: DUF1761 domain-containing protein [Candidatus Taylorbacteria bacterium]